MNIRNFIEEYKKPLIISIVLHLLLISFLSIEFVERKKLEAQENLLSKDTSHSMQAVTVDDKKVTELINNIQREEKQKIRAQQLAKKSLESTKKARVSQERKLKSLQTKHKKLEQELKKMRLKQKKALKEFDQKQKQASSKLLELNKQANKIEKDNVEQKKLAAERAKMLEKQTATILQRYKAAIQDKIKKNLIATPEQTKKKLVTTIDLTLNPQGEVIKIKIVKTSGDQFFDRAALLAIKKSSPLPVPDDKKVYKKMSEIRLNCNA